MSRICFSSSIFFFLVVAVVLVLAKVSSAQNTPAPPNNCADGCNPRTGPCTAGNNIKFALLVDACDEHSRSVLVNATEIVYGYCAQVDQLQAFQLPNSTVGAAGDAFLSKNGNKTNTEASSNATASYVRIFNAVGDYDSYVPNDNFDASALLFDPKQTCTKDGNPGFLIANFLVINMTMTNGKFKSVSGQEQAVQVGFMPTCDGEDSCQISPDSPCLGNMTGQRNCAICATSYNDLVNNPVTIFASYYGTDANGRKMQSGASNPLNFLALSSTGVFNKLKGDVNNAFDTVKQQVPGQ